MREIPFPSVGDRSTAREIRTGWLLVSLTDTVVVIQRGRSFALLYFALDSISALEADRRLMVKLAKTVASRM